MKVIKRDCSEAEFDKQKIVDAIMKAMKNGSGIVKPHIATSIADEIEYENKDCEEIDIYTIENLIFNKLISKKQKLTARSFEGYRSIREFQRECNNTTDSQIMELLANENEYLKDENSNKNSVLATTQRDYMAGTVSTDLTRRILLTPEIVNAHDEGIIHFHDADYFAQPINNCCLINADDMLQNGTIINGKFIEKPHRFVTASTILTQIITAVASSQYGGTSITLTHLAPFVRESYKRLLKKYQDRNHPFEECEKYALEDLHKEIEDGVQTFNYQINSMQTTNGQAPFITVFMYLNETNDYKWELSLIIEEFLKQRLLGIKNENGVYISPAFPKLIYVLEEDNCLNGGEYDYLTRLAIKCSAKRLVPDYISEKKMKEIKDGNCFPSMGCRSFLSPWKDNDGNYKFYGRFNQGVVTINLVDVALSSEKDEEKFWELMEERTELCHKALMARHNRLEGTLSDVAPILWQHGAFARLNKNEKIDKLLHGGYSSISLGYAGLYECVKYMTNESLTSSIGEEFGLRVMKFMNDKCDQWNEEHYIGYSIYGTPIESTTYKFAKCLKKRFGNDVFVQIDGHDRDYITNSYHVPVFENIDAFSKLEKESKFQSLSTGGAISYIEVPNMQHNLEALEDVIKFIYNNIMYAELNTKSDYCQCCGYDGEIKIIKTNDGKLDWQCPQCGNMDHDKMNVIRRTCGYLGENFWNQGRTNEINERVLHL